VVACVLFLYPPIVTPMLVIWKDCLMAGFLVLGVAMFYDQRRNVRLGGLGVLFIASAMRYNALAATLPLVVFGFEWERGMRRLPKYAIAIGAWLAISALALGLNTLLTDRKMHFWASTFALADITGTLAHVDRHVPDEELRPLLAPTQIRIDRDYHVTLRSLYKPATSTQLIAGPDRLWTVPIAGIEPTPEPQREAIGRAWSEIVFGNAGAFLRYRADVFAEILGLRKKFEGATVMRRRSQVPERLAAMGIADTRSGFTMAAERALVWTDRKTSRFSPWLYAVLALVLLAFSRRNRDVLALLSSGLVMEASMFALGATPDYRYSHWLVITTCLSVAILIARRYALARHSSGTPAASPPA
jgi:hypothetical protein